MQEKCASRIFPAYLYSIRRAPQALAFTEPAQDAPVIHAGEKWAFLLWRMGGWAS